MFKNFLVLFFLIILGASMTVDAAAPIKTATLINAATSTGTGDKVTPWYAKRTFHAIGSTTAGSGASTIDVEVSNDGVNYIAVDTLSLTLGTTITSDSYVLDAAWKYVRGNR